MISRGSLCCLSVFFLTYTIGCGIANVDVKGGGSFFHPYVALGIIAFITMMVCFFWDLGKWKEAFVRPPKPASDDEQQILRELRRSQRTSEDSRI